MIFLKKNLLCNVDDFVCNFRGSCVKIVTGLEAQHYSRKYSFRFLLQDEYVAHCKHFAYDLLICYQSSFVILLSHKLYTKLHCKSPGRNCIDEQTRELVTSTIPEKHRLHTYLRSKKSPMLFLKENLLCNVDDLASNFRGSCVNFNY